MFCLLRYGCSPVYIIVIPNVISQAVISAVNLQHDCHRGRCEASGSESLRREREVTTSTRTIVKHSDSDHFIVNMHALHNHEHISRVVPLELRASSFKVDDEKKLREDAAMKVRDKKNQQALAKQDLLFSQMIHASEATHEEPGSTSNELVSSLDNDRDLIHLIGNMFGGDAQEQPDLAAREREADHVSTEQGASSSSAEPPAVARCVLHSRALMILRQNQVIKRQKTSTLFCPQAAEMCSVTLRTKPRRMS